MTPEPREQIVMTDHVYADVELEQQVLADAGLELRFDGHRHGAEEILAVAADAIGIINCFAPMPREVIDGLKRCRVISRSGVGVDHIDVEAATSRGIIVTNVPDYCIEEVADHTLALLLALNRQLLALSRSVREGEWNVLVAAPIHQLRTLTLGLVGFGRIGRAVATRASGFGLRVLAHDPLVEGPAIAAAGAEPRDLPALLREADVVSLHLPSSPETHHLIDAAALEQMQAGAYLINTSRGDLVDADALVDALDANTIAGAAIDVLEEEPPRQDERLLTHPKAFVTPHAAYYSEESSDELSRRVAQNAIEGLEGCPATTLNPEALRNRDRPT